MEQREIVIVGAGPSGSTAAIALRQQGHDVLLIDRQTFPRDKPCGDGIPVRVTEIFYDLGLKETFDQANFYPIDTVRLISPAGHIYESEMKRGKQGAGAHVIPRLQFDALLQEQAVLAGAEFLQARVKEPLVENGQVRGVKVHGTYGLQEIRARLVLAADGATSVISRALQPHRPPDVHRAVALRAYMDEFEVLPNQVEFFLHKKILPGYAWVFPLGAHKANIGLGMRLDKFRQQNLSLEQLLEKFLMLPFMKERIRDDGRLQDVATWQLNFGSQKRLQRAFAGALLLGDAGWLIDPLTGGGIENGMISALLAAQTAHRALQQGDCSRQMLQEYERACQAALWPVMRRSYFIQRWVLHSPWLLDLLIKYAHNHPHLTQLFLAKL
ncbi:MAG TPA: NAD(P)/FAD-dependent oxidoreductase [Chloroflexota bacterium]|nr:NAD(P)/FAD-dependent oxidoreductase [Chloroflexota bacterium]HUM69976.1 NAD(P)/FAD-dependent oxidoreductase [Chloroflexota bacterium]